MLLNSTFKHGKNGVEFGPAVRMQLEHPHPTLEYLGSIPGSANSSSFLLTKTLEGSGDGLDGLGSFSPQGRLGFGPSCWFLP